MKTLLIIIGFLVSVPAWAEENLPAAAYGQEIMECTGGKVQLRAQIIALQAEIERMKAERSK